MKQQNKEPEYSNQANKYLNSLDRKKRERLKNGIEKIPEGDIKHYKSEPGCFRLRVGNYRVLYKWINDVQILILLIENRGKAYRKGV